MNFGSGTDQHIGSFGKGKYIDRSTYTMDSSDISEVDFVFHIKDSERLQARGLLSANWFVLVKSQNSKLWNLANYNQGLTKQGLITASRIRSAIMPHSV